MPLPYDMACPNGHEFEVWESIKNHETKIKPGVSCPECGALAKQKIAAPKSIIGDSDICDPFYSYADGKYYSSKKKYRAALKAHDMIELGNERPKKPKFKPTSFKKQLSDELKKIEERQ